MLNHLTINVRQRIDRRRSHRILTKKRKKSRALAYDGANILNFILEQIEDTNTNPTTYFFHDESELEITVKEAAYVVTKFMELSDDHKEAWIENVGKLKLIPFRFHRTVSLVG